MDQVIWYVTDKISEYSVSIKKRTTSGLGDVILNDSNVWRFGEFGDIRFCQNKSMRFSLCFTNTDKEQVQPEVAFHYKISLHTYPCISNPHLWIIYLVGLYSVSSLVRFVSVSVLFFLLLFSCLLRKMAKYLAICRDLLNTHVQRRIKTNIFVSKTSGSNSQRAILT